MLPTALPYSPKACANASDEQNNKHVVQVARTIFLFIGPFSFAFILGYLIGTSYPVVLNRLSPGVYSNESTDTSISQQGGLHFHQNDLFCQQKRPNC
jgi:hypothetical protein